MVGIILATHGDFATGILQSASMLFGDQENVKAVTLQPNEGPDDIKQKMEEAISTLENQNQVLFMVDLKGGTPYNQANGLIKDHESQWELLTGLNLPMLLEAYGTRMTVETAHEVAVQVQASGREGIQGVLEQVEKKEEKKAVRQNALPVGTVVGNGKIEYVLARIDSRLLHGQVATSWTKATNPTRIMVVSDTVARDDLRRNLIEEAAPPGVKANVIPIDKMIQVAKDPRFGDTRALILFETPQDALRAIEGGVDIKEINVGTMAHSLGKVAVSKTISLDQEDVKTFEKLKEKGIGFDVRIVSADSRGNMEDIFILHVYKCI